MHTVIFMPSKYSSKEQQYLVEWGLACSDADELPKLYIAAFRTATNNKNRQQRLSFPFKASHHERNDYENDAKVRDE